MVTNSVLRDPKRELFAQKVSAGVPKEQAYQEAGYLGKSKMGSSRLMNIPAVRARINEIMDAGAKRSELTRKGILERIFEDWETARKLGQIPAALKAGELLGREMFRMFTERKEIGGPGDFDQKSEEELRQIVTEELKQLGWEDLSTQPPSDTVN